MTPLEEALAEKARRAAGSTTALDEALAEKARRQPGVVEDIAKSAPGALRRGAETIPGAAGDLPRTGGTIIGKALSLLGMDPARAEAYGTGVGQAAATAFNPLATVDVARGRTPQPMPTSSEIHAATTPVLGEDYKPQTLPGKFTSSALEQVPGAMIGPGGWAMKGTQAIGGGIGAEAGGQAARLAGAEPGGSAETIARITGNLAGGFTPSVSNQLMRPRPISPARQANINVFEREGIPASAGQRTGNVPLKYREAEAGFDLEPQKEAFSRSALGRTGLPAGTARAPASVVDAELERMGQEFNRLTGNTSTAFDQPLQDELLNVATTYADETPMATSFVENFMNDLARKSAANSGVMTGEVYQNARSKLGEIIRGGDKSLRGPAIDMQEALDDAVSRNMSPEQLAEWNTVRQQYRNFLPVEHAVGASGQDAATGVVSPQGLRTGVRATQGRRAVAAGRNVFGDLLEAGGDLMTPLPQSGTAPRLQAIAKGVGPLLASGAGLGLTGDPMLAGGIGLAAATLPVARNAALISGPGQAFLARQGPVMNTDRQGLAATINAARQAQLEQMRREQGW